MQKLKARLDADVDRVDLSSPDILSDINDVTGVLKLWFRELPDPLMTYELYNSFMEAARTFSRPINSRSYSAKGTDAHRH